MKAKGIHVLSILMLSGLIFSNIQNNKSQAITTYASDVSLEECKIVDIAAGVNFNLALDQHGNLWSWGLNDKGQLGNGTKTNSLVPIQIMKGHRFKQISAGNGYASAIDIDGYLYKWGQGSNTTPTLESDTVKYKQAYANYDVNIGLPVEDANSFYYGYGRYYHYSEGSSTVKTSSSNIPYIKNSSLAYRFSASSEKPLSEEVVAADGNYNNYYSYTRPGYMSGGTTSYHYYDMFFVNQSGSVQYFHSESSGTCYFKSISLSAFDNTNIKDVSVKKQFPGGTTMCSIAFFVDDEGNGYSLGKNTTTNMMGIDGAPESSTTPLQITGLSNIKRISAGLNHVLAITNDGKLYSWGENEYGQLGTGSLDSIQTPTRVTTFDSVGSFNFTCLANDSVTGTFNQFGAESYSISTPTSKGNITLDETTGDFTFTVGQVSGGYDYGVVSISFNGIVKEYQINAYIDNKPVFTGGTPTLELECGETIYGSAPCDDVDNDTLTYSLVQNPIKGEVVFLNNSGSFSYTARTDVAAGDSFIIGVSDGYCTVEFPVSIHIQSLISFNDETNIVIDTNQTNTYSGNINAVDIDGDTLTYSVYSAASKGSVAVDEYGNYLYTANGVNYGYDSFTLRVDDGYKPLDITYNVHIYAITDGGTILAYKVPTGESVNSQVITTAFGIEPTYSVLSQGLKGITTIDENSGAYTYVPNEGSAGDDSFIIKVDYGYGSYVLEIHVYQNTIPSDANVNVSLIANENGQCIGSAACIDIDNDILIYTVNSQPTKGSLMLNENTGEFTYTPYNDVAGNDAFTIKVFDGTEYILINFYVHIESEIQLASSLSHNVSQNTSVNGAVNALDKDGDTLVYSIEQSATHGISSVDSLTGNYTYIPFTNYFGEDSFIIKVDDDVQPKYCVIQIRINRKPVAESYTINLTTKGVTISGSSQCSDPDGDALLYSILENPKQGSVILDSLNGGFAYTPNMDAAGDDSFKINTTDGIDSIVITINVHNETDVYLDNQATRLVVNQGKSTTGQVLAVDLDNDPLNYSVIINPTQGTININASTGAWTYYASNEADGVDSFSVKVSDGHSEVILEYDLVINTPATFENDSYSFVTNQGNLYFGQVTAVDGDGDTLEFSVIVQGNKGNVSIDSNTGLYLYSPDENTAGDDFFILGVSDGNFVSQVRVDVHIESDISVANSTINHQVEKNGTVVGNVNATDLDGDALTYSVSQQGEKGLANVDGSGGYSYLANNGAGDDVFVIEIHDDVHTCFVNVYVHISSNPYFESDSISIFIPQGGSTSGQAAGHDDDGDTLTYSISTSPLYGSASVASRTGEYTYSAYQNSTASSDSFVIALTDGNTTVYSNVNVVINNAPQTDKLLSFECKQGGSVSDQITATDPENDRLEYSISSQAYYGRVELDRYSGEFTYYTNSNNYNAKDFFYVYVSDGYSTVVVTVEICMIKNEKPYLDNYSCTKIQVNSGSKVRGGLLIKDPERDHLTFKIATQGEQGRAVLEDNGSFVYYANVDARGYDCFVITVSDGFNEKSFLVEVAINHVDPQKSWSIPATIALGSLAAVSTGVLIFVLLKFGKKIFKK